MKNSNSTPYPQFRVLPEAEIKGILKFAAGLDKCR